MAVDRHDRTILRELAKRVAEIATHPVQEERRQLWYKINSLERCRIPILLVMNDLYWDEVVPESELVTRDPLARRHEHKMRRQIWQWENVDDDYVTEPVVEYFTSIRKPMLLCPKKNRPGCEDLGAYHVEPVIERESDVDKIIVDPECAVDFGATVSDREWVETVFDGILTPVRRTPWLGCAPFDYFCEIRGMENVFMDMVECPEWVEEVMRRLHRMHVDTAKYLEQTNALDLNNRHHNASNGGQCYTDELPADGYEPGKVRLKDIWGHTTAQAAVSISPEMHERFITQFERGYHALFGLTGLGCCETVDKKMHLHRTLPNLRRISISAWNDFAAAAEAIGADYVYSVKPSAASISQSNWDVDKDMAYLRDILEKSKGCHVEVIHREIATCHGRPERLTAWARSAKELVCRR